MQKDNFYSKISKRSFSKIYKNYSKGKISHVLPVNIILSPFLPFHGFHPCNGGEGDLRVSLTHLAQGNQKREKGRERGKGEEREKERERKGERGEGEEREKEREREKELLLAEVSVDCWPVGGSTRRSNRLQGATSDR